MLKVPIHPRAQKQCFEGCELEQQLGEIPLQLAGGGQDPRKDLPGSDETGMDDAPRGTPLEDTNDGV